MNTFGWSAVYDMYVISWFVGEKRGVSTSSSPLLRRRTLAPS